MSFDKRLYTEAVHAGVEPEAITGAIMTPIFQTSTFVQESPGVHKGYDYSRADNPTRKCLEDSLAALEGASHALSFSSGLAAEQAVLQTLDPGSHVLVSDDVYGGTARLFHKLFSKYKIEFELIDMSLEENIKKHLRSETKLLWCETPSNPLLKLCDIQKTAELCKEHKILFVVDNTFASPIFQSPLSLGADICVHSTTKYIGGHSDLIGGALILSDEKLYERLKFIQFAAGSVPSPFECFLLLRSIKTLAIRMVQHDKNAKEIAKFLIDHPKVENVLYPGLSSHPQHSLAKKQMKGFSGMLSFRLKASFKELSRFTKNLKVFSLAESLGGVESLINHPAQMTHASVPLKQRKKLGIDDNLLRLSVGIENSEDLIADLSQALDVLA